MKHDYSQLIKKGILAGIAISLGGALFTLCFKVGTENEGLKMLYTILGALLFSVGLCSVCTFSMNLFTGKAGYFFELEHKSDLIIIWLSNLSGTLICGFLAALTNPSIGAAAALMTASKLSLDPLSLFIKSIFCGMLMFLAVDSYKRLPKGPGMMMLVLCVSCFIISGFEHSIADMFYFAASWQAGISILSLLTALVVISLGNMAGSLIISWLAGNPQKAAEDKK